MGQPGARRARQVCRHRILDYGAAAMPSTAKRLVAIGALAFSALVASGALAQNDGKKAAPPPVAEKSGDGVAHYCDSVAPLAAEARIAWQTRRLTELEGEIKQRIADLDAKEAEARDW